MASCTCHVLCGTKRLRLERIVRLRQLRPMCNLLKVVCRQYRYVLLAGSIARDATGEAAASRAPSQMRRQRPQLIKKALDALVCVILRVANPKSCVWARGVH